MATHLHLPIYSKFYKFTIILFERIKHFNNLHKHVTGNFLIKRSLTCFEKIIEANNQADSYQKSIHIQELINILEAINITLRLCQESNIISKKQYTKLIELLNNVLKQANAWSRKHNNLSDQNSKNT